ncbi:MAG: PD-(D/E)XK nuclease family protein, partial [Candidatus Nanopelagicales bacterium]
MAYPPRAPVPVAVPPAPLPERPWSASAIEDFLGCPLRYWWRKVAGWQTPSTVPMVTGRAVHLALEHLLELPPDERLPERADVFLAEAIASELAEAGPHIPEGEVTTGAHAAMAAYWQTEVPADIEVAPDGLEMTVEVPLRGLPFLGYIDRVAVVDTGLR